MKKVNTSATEAKKELTPDEQAAKKMADFWKGVDDKVESIGLGLKCKVFPIVLVENITTGAFVVGYARVPDLITQLRLIDKSAGNENGYSLEACSTALTELLISAETDERITNKQDLNYWKGACLTLAQFMGVATPIIKKK
jgi:hypothetical protein